MDLGPINFDEVLFVVRNMRAWDKREIYATRWNDDPVELAGDVALCGRFGWIAGILGVPVAVVGAAPVHSGVWSAFMFATDDFRQISLSLTKFAKRVMIPALVATGAHRAECLSLAGHTDAHRWLESLGAKPEGVAAGFGRGREDFVRYVWRR